MNKGICRYIRFATRLSAGLERSRRKHRSFMDHLVPPSIDVDGYDRVAFYFQFNIIKGSITIDQRRQYAIPACESRSDVA